jgi:hypothetical protein
MMVFVNDELERNSKENLWPKRGSTVTGFAWKDVGKPQGAASEDS